MPTSKIRSPFSFRDCVFQVQKQAFNEQTYEKQAHLWSTNVPDMWQGIGQPRCLQRAQKNTPAGDFRSLQMRCLRPWFSRTASTEGANSHADFINFSNKFLFRFIFRSITTFIPAPLARISAMIAAECSDSVHRFQCTRRICTRNTSRNQRGLGIDTSNKVSQASCTLSLFRSKP